MSNFKWGIVLGTAAFVLSIFLGIISDVSFSHIILRALLFLVIFFGLGVGAHVLINNYYPEVLYEASQPARDITIEKPDSQISFSLGRTGEYAVPEMFSEYKSTDELGNIEDLLSGNYRIPPEPPTQLPEDIPMQFPAEGVDLKTEESYNNLGRFAEDEADEAFGVDDGHSLSEPQLQPQEPVFEPRPAFAPSFGEDDGLEGLPDLGSLAMAFTAKGDSLEAGMGEAGPPSFFGSQEAFAPETPPDEEKKPYKKGSNVQPLKGDFDPKDIALGIRTVLSKDN